MSDTLKYQALVSAAMSACEQGGMSFEDGAHARNMTVCERWPDDLPEDVLRGRVKALVHLELEAERYRHTSEERHGMNGGAA